jgi:hypothetical protein
VARLSIMTQHIAEKIIAEMKVIETDIIVQKRVIKSCLGSAELLDVAQADLKALHTRLAKLKHSLEKTRASEPAEPLLTH